MMPDEQDPYGLPPQRRPPGEWDPFAPDVQAYVTQAMREVAEAERRARRAQFAAVFGTPHGRAWLVARWKEESERPSYEPGDAPELAAWREGRKAFLLGLLRELHEATGPAAAGPNQEPDR